MSKTITRVNVEIGGKSRRSFFKEDVIYEYSNKFLVKQLSSDAIRDGIFLLNPF